MSKQELMSRIDELNSRIKVTSNEPLKNFYRKLIEQYEKQIKEQEK